MLLEKEHDVAHGPVLAPGFADTGQLAEDAGHFGQLVDFCSSNTCRVRSPKWRTMRRAIFGPTPRIRPGTKIFFQGSGAGRFELGGEPGLELAAESGVLRPVAGELHGGPGKNPHPAHCHRGRIAQLAEEETLSTD